MTSLLDEIMQIPSLDSHEHIGYISSIYQHPDRWHSDSDMKPGFEAGPTSIFDVILSSFMGLCFSALGYKPEVSPPYHVLTGKEQEYLWQSLLPYLKANRGTGFYIGISEALHDLYGASLDDLIAGKACWKSISDAIEANYQFGLFRWTKAMFEKAKISLAIKLVHPSYLTLLESQGSNESYILEKQIFVPAMRIEDLMGYETNDFLCSWKYVEEALGITINDIEGLELMVDKTFELLTRNRIPAIKQAQAYLRTLRFQKVERDEAQQAFKQLKQARDRAAKLVVQDYILGLILERAKELQLPFQVHTGMANLPDSNPALLTQLITRHPEVDFILLHGYPYFSEAAFMANSYNKNVYLDSAWLGLMSPALLYQSLSEWIGYVPYTKICLSGDTTSVEECYGAMKTTRKVLARVLSDKISYGEMDKDLALDIARAMLYDNSAKLYKL